MSSVPGVQASPRHALLGRLTWPWARVRASRGDNVANALVVASVVFVIGGWELGSRVGVLDVDFFSRPSLIGKAAYTNLQTMAFWNNVWVSTKEFAIGYGLAVVVAVPFGLLTGWFRRLQYLFDPWLNGLNATPRIALLPLVVLWFGLGLESKIAIVFLGVFVSVAINTFHGIRTVDAALLDVSRSFGATTTKQLVSVVLPSVVPFALVGLRLGIGRAVAGVMVGEYFTSQAGLGYFIFRAGQTLQTDKLLFGAVFITVLALLAFWGISREEKRFTAWRPRVGSA